VNADAQSLRKLVLGEASKPAESHDVLFWINLAANDTFTLPSRNRAREILIGQLTNVVSH